MACDLDRFSQPLWREGEESEPDLDDLEDEPFPICQGCGYEIDLKTDRFIASDLWEDEWIHEDVNCLAAYSEKERGVKKANDPSLGRRVMR